MTSSAPHLRSQQWFSGREELAFQNRAALRAMGLNPDDFAGKPVIGIANSWSELNNCNANLRDLADAVKRGVLLEGGLPLEFPTISLGEEFMKPSAMLYRNLMAMDVEETLRANPINGVVLLCNCDKTTPAQLMAAASADLPAIQLNGGPRAIGHWRGETIGSGTDLWKYSDELRAGRLSQSDWRELEASYGCGVGACNTMGTASTMASLSEALGMMLPGTASIPATDSRRLQAATATGRRIVQMVHENLRPSRILTLAAFDNAIRALLALGGSTNAVVHLIAIAGRRNIRLPLSRFDELSQSTPFLVNLAPSGKHLMDAFHAAGGLPAVMAELCGREALDEHVSCSASGSLTTALSQGEREKNILHLGCLTVTGKTLGENIACARSFDRDVIRSRETPLLPGGSLAVLTGNLAPRGAVIKVSAASPKLMKHGGRAIVFRDYQDMLDRVNDPALPVDADSVLVLQNAGP
ncbi:MAG TPA: dihydroxy-acid dehydratase, partial [Planctomycetaceae bacterium]|nr:dihydroxy-acid dehydratase [Planctomycetaceae bacterium]